MKELPEVKVGQVWADNDWRSRGRTVKVLSLHCLDQPYMDPYACVEVLTVANGSSSLTKPGRKFNIKLRRFRPNSTGYRLIEESQ